MSDSPSVPLRTRTIVRAPEPAPVPAPNTPQASYDQLAEQRLIEFVEKQIQDMRERTKLGSGKDPTFYEVNEALMNYQDTHLALLSMYHNAKFEHNRAKEAFDDWFADKYIFVRDTLNPRSISAQKWYSQKEVEMEVRSRYKDDYTRLSWDVTLTDQQLSFMRRMLDNWAQYAFILNQLSKNLIAEVKGLGVESALSDR